MYLTVGHNAPSLKNQLQSIILPSFIKRLKPDFYSYTLYLCLQKIAEKEKKYKPEQAILNCKEVKGWNG